MDPLPPCRHTFVALLGSWQADLEARILCRICGADLGLKDEQVKEYERIAEKDLEAAAKYLARLLTEGDEK